MEITLNTYKENKTDTTAYFTLIDGENTFKWHGDIQQTGMSEAQIQSWLEANIEKLRGEIYRKIYPEAVIVKFNDETDLEAWQRWISNGCKNIVVVNEVEAEVIIPARDWEDTH